MSKPLQQDHYKVKPIKEVDEKGDYLLGRGAQINTKNRFLKDEITREHVEGIDDWDVINPRTVYLEQNSKTIVNKSIAMPETCMNTGATAQGLILNKRLL
jgi:hypothetical protein